MLDPSTAPKQLAETGTKNQSPPNRKSTLAQLQRIGALSRVAVLGPPKMLREGLNGSLQKAAQQRLAERPRARMRGVWSDRRLWADHISASSVIPTLHRRRQPLFDPAERRTPSKSFCCNFCCQTVQDCVASHNNNTYPQLFPAEKALQGFPPPTLYLVRARWVSACDGLAPSFLWFMSF